jgi:hypothetical protein
MTPTSTASFARALLATVLSVLTAMPARVCAATAQIAAFAPAAAATSPKYTREAYESLKALIDSRAPAEMNLDFFKEVYRHEHAPEMLKLMFGSEAMKPKSHALAQLRKFYTWSIIGDWARGSTRSSKLPIKARRMARGATWISPPTYCTRTRSPESWCWATRRPLGSSIISASV